MLSCYAVSIISCTVCQNSNQYILLCKNHLVWFLLQLPNFLVIIERGSFNFPLTTSVSSLNFYCPPFIFLMFPRFPGLFLINTELIIAQDHSILPQSFCSTVEQLTHCEAVPKACGQTQEFKSARLISVGFQHYL